MQLCANADRSETSCGSTAVHPPSPEHLTDRTAKPTTRTAQQHSPGNEQVSLRPQGIQLMVEPSSNR